MLPPGLPDGERAFICHEVGCGEAFSMRSHLTEHHCLTHRRDWRFLCPFPGCSKAYMQRSHLTQHNSVAHRGERPFCCTEEGCEKAYTKLSHLKQHQSAAHRGERPFLCDEPGCTKSYTVRSHLSAHITTAHRRAPTSRSARRMATPYSDRPHPLLVRAQSTEYASSGVDRGCGSIVLSTVLSAAEPSAAAAAGCGWPMMAHGTAYAQGFETSTGAQGGPSSHGAAAVHFAPTRGEPTLGADACARRVGVPGGAPSSSRATAQHSAERDGSQQATGSAAQLGGWRAQPAEPLHRAPPPPHAMLAAYAPSGRHYGDAPRAVSLGMMAAGPPRAVPLGGMMAAGPPAGVPMMLAGGGGYYGPPIVYAHAVVQPMCAAAYLSAPYQLAYAPPPAAVGYPGGCYASMAPAGGGGGYAPQPAPAQPHHAHYRGACEASARGAPWPSQLLAPAHALPRATGGAAAPARARSAHADAPSHPPPHCAPAACVQLPVEVARPPSSQTPSSRAQQAGALAAPPSSEPSRSGSAGAGGRSATPPRSAATAAPTGWETDRDSRATAEAGPRCT